MLNPCFATEPEKKPFRKRSSRDGRVAGGRGVRLTSPSPHALSGSFLGQLTQTLPPLCFTSAMKSRAGRGIQNVGGTPSTAFISPGGFSGRWVISQIPVISLMEGKEGPGWLDNHTSTGSKNLHLPPWMLAAGPSLPCSPHVPAPAPISLQGF